MRTGQSPAVLFALLLILPALALVTSLPSHPMIFGVLSNAAHAPVFGAFAIVALILLRRYTRSSSRQYVSAFVITVVVGGLIELIQPVLGRDGELADVGTDALGAVGGLAIDAFLRSQRRWLPAIVLVIAAMAASWPIVEASLAYWERSSQAPAILEISSRFDWYFIWTRGVRVSTAILPEPWRRAGDPESVRLQFTQGRWRVLGHGEPFPDWRGYTRLMIDLTNPGPAPLRLTLRVHDRAHDSQATDRFNRQFTLAGGKRTVLATPISEIARAPDARRIELSRIAGVMIFAGGNPGLANREFYVTRIWLE